MGDKKRKVVEDPTDEPIGPEGKKLKKDKKEKKAKKEEVSKEVVDAVPTETAPVADQPKERSDSKYKNYKEAMKEKRAEKKEKKREKREKKDKKYKPKDQAADGEAENENGESPLFYFDTEGEKREKKERKDRKYNKKKVKKAAAAEKKQEGTAPQEDEEKKEEEPVNGEEEVSNEVEQAAKEKNARFLCFVGNLPYSANTESVKKHFEKNPPAAVRVLTKKDQPKKCRGFAFIEFDNFDRMKTALKLYHHSTFDDGKYPPRRINVELTAGGGGANSEHRKAKIQAKNEKLNDERQRSAKQIKKDKRKHTKPAQGGATGANAVGVDGADGADQFAGLHPSRRGRLH